MNGENRKHERRNLENWEGDQRQLGFGEEKEGFLTRQVRTSSEIAFGWVWCVSHDQMLRSMA